MTILSTNHRQRNSANRKKEKPCWSYLSWVKQHVSEIDLGREVEDAKGIHPIHLNKNHKVLAHFENLRRGYRSWLDEQWNWSKLKDHGSFSKTYYFAGAPERCKPSTMFLLDVDCKRRGTFEGARAFLSYISSEACAREYGLSFPSLYTEASTHGRGGHGFPLLDKWDYYPEFINDLLLHRLQPWLNRIAQEKDFDIEFVEVKGTLPVFEWGNEKYEVLSYTAGCLGKLPREGQTRFTELQKTSVITIVDFSGLPLAKVEVKKKEAPAAKSMGELPVGSFLGKHITDDLLAGLQEGGRYRIVADTLLGAHTLRTSGRQVVRIEDLAITLMLGEWFTNHMLPNGAMPEDRWKGLWSSLKVDGEITRGWCHKRFKAIRDWLSSLGLLDWEDRTYQVGWYDEAGVYHKGKAAKWRFGAGLMEMLVLSDDGSTRVSDNSDMEMASNDNPCVFGSDNEDSGVHNWPVAAALTCTDRATASGPKKEEEGRHPLWEHGSLAWIEPRTNKEEGRHPLWEHDLQGQVETFDWKPDAEPIRPVERARSVIYQFDPDEITRLLSAS